MTNNINHTSAKALIKNKKRRKMRKKAFTVFSIVFGLAALFGVIVVLAERTRPVKVSQKFDRDEIVYDRPLIAVHEMTVFDPNVIPFLPEDGPQPKIAFSENTYDFGSIGLRDIVTKEFIIANEGEAPLTISNAYTTCGCTTVEITASVIPPGKAALATLVFDAGFHDSGGQTVQRGLIIESNDPQFPKTEIWTRASVRQTP